MPVEPIEDAVMDRDVVDSGENLTNVSEEFVKAQETTSNLKKATRDAILYVKQQKVLNAAVDATVALEKALDPNNTTPAAAVKDLFEGLSDAYKLKTIKDIVTEARKFETSPSGKDSAKVIENMKRVGDSFKSKLYDMIEKKLSPKEMKDFNDARKDHEQAIKDLEDAFRNQDDAEEGRAKDALDKAWGKIDKIIEGNTECNTELESNLGNRKGSILKYLKYFGLFLGTFLGIWALSHYLVKELEGCYQYNGTDSQKIDCPSGGTFGSPSDDAKNYCKCGDATPDLKSVTDLQDFCKNNPQYDKYPFCCAISTAHPTCSGAVGDKDSVYYSYKEFSIPGIIAGIPGDIANLIKNGENLIGDFFKQILNWLLIIFVILVVVYVIFIVGKIILEKTTQQSQSTSIKMSSLF